MFFSAGFLIKLSIKFSLSLSLSLSLSITSSLAYKNLGTFAGNYKTIKRTFVENDAGQDFGNAT